MKPIRVLITGGSGFVGARVAQHLYQQGYQVTVLLGTRDHAEEDIRLLNFATIYSADICREKDVFRAFDLAQPDVVVHSAAIAVVETCENDPDLAMRVNVDGTRVVTDWCLKNSCRCINISSQSVFDGNASLPGGFSEQSIPIPRSVYGKTKLLGEKVVENLETQGVSLRLSLVYGAPLFGKGGFASRIVDSYMSGGSLRFFNDQYRMPVLVDDIPNVIDVLIKKETTVSRIVHLCGPEWVSRVEFARRLYKMFGMDESRIIEISSDDYSGTSPLAKNIVLQCETLDSLGVQRTPLDEGLKACSSYIQTCLGEGISKELAENL